MIDIFLSRPTYIPPEQEGGNKRFLCFIKSYGLESKNIGDN